LNDRTAWKKDFNAVTRGFAISAGRYTGLVPSMEGPPLRGEEPGEKARRRITDVVNRSEVEMDTPQECPQGEAKPESNGWMQET
jgi:hypothetical protein